jgi:hypothetical protein
MASLASGFQGFSRELIVDPAREFVLAMGECLPQLGSHMHAEPKVRGSIFAPSRERPRYYVRLSPERLMLGAGLHAFSDTALARYRHAVLDESRGQKLEAADFDQPLPPQVFSAALTEMCLANFQRLQPLQQWLVEQLPD